MALKETVGETISRHRLILRGQRVLVGFSGGADSAALVCVLKELGFELGFSVCAAHFHHGIRGREADEDEAFCREFCRTREIPFLSERGDVPALSRASHTTPEEAAREARYAFLRRAKEQLPADVIAVAHHRRDQAETVLLHLVRGSGLTGLTGMHPKRGDIVRPMLYASPEEIHEYLTENRIPWRTDSTNSERDCSARNRVRLDVLPYLREHLNPQAEAAISGAAERMRRDDEFLLSLAREALEDSRTEYGYACETLLLLPSPVRARALLTALGEHGISVDVEEKHIRLLTELLTAQTGKRISLPGITARIQYGSLVLERGETPSPEFSLVPELPGKTETPLGIFVCEIIEGNAFTREKAVGYLDFDRLPKDTQLRTRLAGDRFDIVGGPGEKKLKEYYIDRKIPRSERSRVLLCSGKTVLFVPGEGVARSVCVTDKTRRMLKMRVLPEGHSRES